MERILLQPPKCLQEKTEMTDLLCKAQTVHFLKGNRLKAKKKKTKKNRYDMLIKLFSGTLGPVKLKLPVCTFIYIYFLYIENIQIG